MLVCDSTSLVFCIWTSYAMRPFLPHALLVVTLKVSAGIGSYLARLEAKHVENTTVYNRFLDSNHAMIPRTHTRKESVTPCWGHRLCQGLQAVKLHGKGLRQHVFQLTLSEEQEGFFCMVAWWNHAPCCSFIGGRIASDKFLHHFSKAGQGTPRRTGSCR